MNIIAPTEVETIEVKADTIYIVKIPVGNMIASKAQEYINNLKPEFEYLADRGAKVIYSGVRANGELAVTEAHNEYELNKMGWFYTPNLTKEEWDKFVETLVPKDHKHHDIAIALLDNAYAAYKNKTASSFNDINNWKLLAKLTVAVINQAKIFDDVPVTVMSGPVSLVDEQAIEAFSRKMSTSWSLEASQDMKAMHGLDVEDDMVRLVAKDIADEMDEMIPNIKHFCPYILIMFIAVTMDADTFTPTLPMLTRYGKIDKDSV